MDKSEFESQLSAIEAQLAFLHQSSLKPEPNQVAEALAALQTKLLNLSGMARPLLAVLKQDISLLHRLKKSAAMLASLREGLLRQQVVVQRALSALVPATESLTYGVPSGRQRAQPYGAVARQSGEFRMVSA
jgi:hypothetical protein